MKGLSGKAAKAIEQLINGRFNAISLNFLGLIPQLSKKKVMTFSTTRNSLTSLFLHSLGTSKPNKDEEDTLKVLLRIANNYTDALRDRTTARVINSIDSYVKDQSGKSKPVKSSKLKGIIDKEMKSAKNHFKLIANSESNKAANTGTALQIGKLADQKGIDDPTVFFIVTQDDVTGTEEYKIHLMPDRKTPRVWKLSEVGSEYHKKGDKYPKLGGLHPNCRCKLTYLAEGFGFDKDGKVTFKSLGYDEFKKQRDNSTVKKSEEDFIDTKQTEHPNNTTQPDRFKHMISHKTNNGKDVWAQKHLKWGGKEVSKDNIDTLHRSAWKSYATQNKIPKGSSMSNTLVNLNKQVVNDNDRHLRMSGTSNNINPKHQEIRQRHMIYALGGQKGYSIDEVRHPKTGDHMGVRIKAPRHHKDGNLGETSWFFDGNNLKTEYNKITGKKWK